MSTILKVHNGVASSVYDDRWCSITNALGTPHIKRATSIEYDNGSGQWVATHLPTGQIIGRCSNRNPLIRLEISWLEARLDNKPIPINDIYVSAVRTKSQSNIPPFTKEKS